MIQKLMQILNKHHTRKQRKGNMHLFGHRKMETTDDTFVYQSRLSLFQNFQLKTEEAFK